MVNHGKPLKPHHLCCVSDETKNPPLLRTQGTHGDDLFDLCDANLAVGLLRATALSEMDHENVSNIFTRKTLYSLFFG